MSGLTYLAVPVYDGVDSLNLNIVPKLHCVKRVHIRGYFWSVFSCILIYSVNLRIQSKDRKTRTRNNSVFGHFSRNVKRQSQLIIKDLFNKSLLFIRNHHLSGIKVRFYYYTNLSELINFYSPRNHQKTIGFLMISE